MVQPYYLTRMIYLPRVVAYWLASLVTFSQGLESVALPAWLLLISLWVYPHVAYRVASGKPGSPIAAVNSLQLDAVFVGLPVIANDFHVFAATSFIAALTMSSLLIGTMPALCRQLVIVYLVVSFGYWLTDTRASKLPSADLQDWAGGLAVIVYGALVAGSGYHNTICDRDLRGFQNFRTYFCTHLLLLPQRVSSVEGCSSN